jgi:hypothetical protein
MHSCAAAVHAFAQLSNAATVKKEQILRQQQQQSQQQQQHSSSSGSTAGAVAAQAGQQLLLQMTHANNAVDRQQLLGLLPASDSLALLLSVPKLHLRTTDACTAGATLLLALQQQQHLTTSQVVQLAVATAQIAVCSNRNLSVWAAMQHQSSSSSSPAAVARAYIRQLAVQLTQRCGTMSAVELRLSVAAVAKLQASLDALVPSTPIPLGNSSSSSSRRKHTHSAVDGRTFTMEQVATTFSWPIPEVGAFAAAAGAALGGTMSVLTPHQRSVVAASLAVLGYRPKPHWLELLLQYSSCDLSECSNKDLVRLLKGLGVMWQRMQQQQQQQQQRHRAGGLGHGEHAAAAGGIQPNVLQDWAADWLQECGSRWGSLSAGQLVGVAQALAGFFPHTPPAVRRLVSSPVAADRFAGAGSGVKVRLFQPFRSVQQQQQQDSNFQQRQYQQQQQQQQQQQAVLQLPSSWQEGFLAASAAVLPQLAPPELLILLAAVRRMGLTPSQEWCAAAAATAAGMAAVSPAAPAAGAGTGTAAAAAAGMAAMSPAAAAAAGRVGQLRPHHVGWLALHLSQLGYVPPADVQAALLQYVAASCDSIRSQHTASATRPAGSAQQALAEPSSLSAAAAAADGPVVLGPVPPRQLWQLLVLLQAAGWGLGPDWLLRVQGSAAGARLRRWLVKRPQLGTWQQLWISPACTPAQDV